MRWRRLVLAAALSLAAAAGGVLVAGTAHAQKVTTGSLKFSGDSGDYISQGKSWSYSTGKGDELTVSSSSGSTVSISVNAYNGDWWTLTFDAPGTQVLVPRTYTGAHRHPFNGTGPGLSLSGEGRGCNELTGSFTVIKAVFGANGYVQTFDATFEQHCEGGSPAARGEVHISNPAPPREAETKPAATSRPRTATTRPQAGSTRPKATPTTSRPASPTSQPSASASATAAGGINTAANDTDAGTPALRASVKNSLRGPLLLIGVVVAWVALVAIGLIVTGLVMHARGH